MDNLEKVEKLVAKTGITYQEAKEVLERNEYDLLEAMIDLEKSGRVSSPRMGSYSTNSNETVSDAFVKTQQEYHQDCSRSSFGKMVDDFIDFCGRILKKMWETKFVIKRKDVVEMNMPVLLLVIGLIFAFWVIVPLLIVGLFLDCRYSFVGVDEIKVDLNGVCKKASETCDEVKQNVMNKKNSADDSEQKAKEAK